MSGNIVKVEKHSHDGRGVVHVDGKTTFIENTLPNEEITFIHTKRHRKYDEGIATVIIKASPDRVTPKCPHALICGGCSQQHINQKTQLDLKQKTVLEQLQHFAKITPQNILPPLTGPLFGYRYRARLSAKYVKQKNKVVVGFHEKNGRYIADIDTCSILHPSIGSLIKQLSELISTLKSYQHIPQIEIAVGHKTTALILRNLEPLLPEDEQAIKNFAKQYNFYLYLQPSNNESTYLLYPDNTSPYLSYFLTNQHDKPIELFFLPTDFTQINYDINQQMVNLAIKLLEPNFDDHILDLFCGLGNFTLPIAKHCASITGIEGSESMVNRAKNNGIHNNIKNANFYCADLNKPLLNINCKHYTKILLDPPRTGALEIVNHINQFAAQKIIYISCNPATFARDSGILSSFGFMLKTLGIIDMFPHTKHIETIALFEPNL